MKRLALERKSAITIQCLARCWLARRLVAYLRLRPPAAVAIQRRYRGIRARKRVAKMRKERIKAQGKWEVQ